MRRSKLLIFTLLFTFICLLFSTLQVEASTPQTSNKITVKGAQIRTSGAVGIRFVGYVEDAYLEANDNISRYGMLLAYGECDVTEIVKGATINGKEVLNAEVTKLSSENYFYINLINVPQDMYGQKITTRSYVVNNGEIVYGDTGAERSLGQVALATKDQVSNSELVDSIYESIESNYKNYYTDSQGNIFITSSVYETVPENLEKEFIKDWNNKFGTNWTEFDYLAFQSSAKAGTTALTADTDTNCAGTNVYEFFMTDQTTSAKWKWLLEYLISVSTGTVHTRRQCYAILDGGSVSTEHNDGYSNGVMTLYQFVHLSASLYNFFTGDLARGGGNDITFTDTFKYTSIVNYNNKIHASNPTLVYYGTEIKLNSVSADAGYDFTGYMSGGGEYHGTYTVSEEDALLTPYFTPIEYDVKFFDNEYELTILDTTYNIENDDITLPSYSQVGYAFNGWYTTSSFDEGTEISVIKAGSIGDIELYAKMEESEYLETTVTLNPNGGYWNDLDILLNNSTILKKGSLTYFESMDWSGSNAILSTSNSGEQWGFIVLKESIVSGVYEIKEIVKGNANITTSNYTYLIKWHTNMSDLETKSVLDSILSDKDEYVGNFVILQNIPTAASKDCSIEFKVINKSDLSKSYTTTYTNPTSLPSIVHENSEFNGWISSVDSTVSKNYPGYKVAHDTVTYTASFDLSGEYVAVDVTLNPNGGVLATPVKTFTVAKYVSYLSDETIYMCTNPNGSTLAWQYKIVLAYDSNLDLYKVVAKAGKNDGISLDQAASDANATWTHAIISAKTDITSYANVGQYISIDFDSLYSSSNTSGTSQTASVYNSGDNVSLNKTYTEPTTLPEPTKDGYVFMGWKSSVDNSIVYKYPGYVVNPGNITYTAQWVSASSAVNATVTFDYNGGATEGLYETNGSLNSTLTLSSYNGNFWSIYAGNVFISTSAYDYKPLKSTRIYIGLNKNTGLHYVVSILTTDEVSYWPEAANYVITISDSIGDCTYDDNFDVNKVNVGDVVFINKTISGISSSNLATCKFYSATLASEKVVEIITSESTLTVPSKLGYEFLGWYDSNGKLYDDISDFVGKTEVSVKAEWAYDDQLIGKFNDQSWVVVGSTIQLSATYLSGNVGNLTYKSNNTGIATVTSEGTVKGVGEGLAEIVAYDIEYPTINFTFYVTVVATAPTGILKVLLESNNLDIYTREDLGIGAGTPAYYYDVIGSVSKLLFEEYVVHKDYYLSSPTKTTSYSSAGVEFVTLHYAADMPYSSKYSLTGGKNLASYNQTASGASWHYSTGNDGVWYCQNTSKGTWHAGSSKTMTWTSSGVTTSQVGTDVRTTDVTLKSDNYFYIKGVKTSVKNTTGYSYTKMGKMGLGVKLVGSTWYLGGHYYNSSYGYICSTGGNNNSIGIESSVREGSDLWLTWQYSAQLCAQLLIQFGLPIQRLVGHHFFSGKDCPQPLLENDLEIWYEFVKMTEKEMQFYKAGGSSISMSTNSKYIKSNGRITSLPEYSECVTYTVTYKDGSTTKTITL